jgi:hypothetical protein
VLLEYCPDDHLAKEPPIPFGSRWSGTMSL